VRGLSERAEWVFESSRAEQLGVGVGLPGGRRWCRDVLLLRNRAGDGSGRGCWAGPDWRGGVVDDGGWERVRGGFAAWVGLLLHGGLFADERVGFVVLLFCAETG